jgi:hypothetical protein
VAVSREICKIFLHAERLSPCVYVVAIFSRFVVTDQPDSFPLLRRQAPPDEGFMWKLPGTGY